MPNEETKVYTASLPVALLADLEECAADQHLSVNSILCPAAEDFIRTWRATPYGLGEVFLLRKETREP